MAEEKHVKDIHRYSFTRLNTFRECPRKHHYLYVEQIPEPENEYTLGGSFFHRCLEAILSGEEPDEIYEEFHHAVDTGKLHMDRDQLEYSINAYFGYYYKNYTEEETEAVEDTITYPLEDEDTMVVKPDQVFSVSGFYGIRDTKTTRSELKYDQNMVMSSMQLLMYVRPVEEKFNHKIDFIEIDEVRLAKLATEVPLIKNGKPSTSLDALSLVTASLYREELERQNLLEDQKYQSVLYLLEQRGHPLFNRVRYQLSNRQLLQSNQEQVDDLYTGASLDLKYRNKDKSRCFMCPFKNICEHDEQIGGEQFRNKIIDSINN